MSTPPALSDNPNPSFDGMDHQQPVKMGETEQKWLKNIYVVPLGFLIPPGCLSLYGMHLFSTIRYGIPSTWLVKPEFSSSELIMEVGLSMAMLHFAWYQQHNVRNKQAKVKPMNSDMMDNWQTVWCLVSIFLCTEVPVQEKISTHSLKKNVPNHFGKNVWIEQSAYPYSTINW